jgi:hypothetical protein
VLYVDLVHKITEEENWNDILSAFEDFQQNEKYYLYYLFSDK